MIMIRYTDDFGKKHLAFVKNVNELNFYKNRFYKVEIDYSFVPSIKS